MAKAQLLQDFWVLVMFSLWSGNKACVCAVAVSAWLMSRALHVVRQKCLLHSVILGFVPVFCRDTESTF